MNGKAANKTEKWLAVLEYAAIFLMAIAFFVISRCGFLREDDLLTRFEVSSLSEVFHYTKLFYMTKGGRWFSVASQYLFAGALGDSKIWFDIVNTLFFLLLILVCVALIRPGKESRPGIALVFTLAFWFLCPDPRESVFWVAGAVTYLWAISITFLFLAVFFHCRDENYGIGAKIGLFLLSFVSATEFVSCAAICGAFAVYYVFHLKDFRKNAVPMVIGFALGSLVVLMAPGNFARAAWEGQSFMTKLHDLAEHPLLEISKYKALWLFVLSLVVGRIRNKATFKAWMKDNSILLLSLGWGVIAFSIVFRPLNRALFFPEVLSLVLLIKFWYDNYRTFAFGFMDRLSGRKGLLMRSACLVILFAVFVVDAVFAVRETDKQRRDDDALQNRIAASGGIVAVDRMVSSHRMAYVESFPEWTWEPLADKFALDSVHVYPYFCQDKFYAHDNPGLENTYVEEIHVGDDSFGRMVRLIARIETDDPLPDRPVEITVDYTRPHKWYRSLLNKVRDYKYDRTISVVYPHPEVCYNGYCYYVVWMKRENAANLKHVTITVL